MQRHAGSMRQGASECEMCGSKSGTRRYMVSGTEMRLGMCCAKYGEPLDAPATPGSQAAVAQNLERRQSRMGSKDVYAQETWDLVSDYGTRIRQAREKKGWSHDQLGNKVSARVPQLKQIEANHLRPSDDLAKRFEKELGITLLEKVEATAPQPKAQGGKGLTIGDLLKDAMNKK